MHVHFESNVNTTLSARNEINLANESVKPYCSYYNAFHSFLLSLLWFLSFYEQSTLIELLICR